MQEMGCLRMNKGIVLQKDRRKAILGSFTESFLLSPHTLLSLEAKLGVASLQSDRIDGVS